LWPLIAEAESPETKLDRLNDLSQHSSIWVRQAVHNNPHSTDDTIIGMIADERNANKLGWIDALRGRPGLEVALAAWPVPEVRADLAFTYARAPGDLARNTQELLARDSSEHVRGNMARTASYRDLFELLLVDERAHVRSLCAGNPRIDREQMEILIADSDRKVRVGAVALGWRYPDSEQLTRLASDKSAAVRWEVLFHPRSPRLAIKMIAEDADEDNRRHANLRLADEMALFSDQVVASVNQASDAAIPGRFQLN
jgi:hypothetical protein